MKKIFLVLMVVFVLALVSCTGKTNKLFDFNSDLYYESKGLSFVTEKPEYTTDVTEINYTITNIGTEEKAISCVKYGLLYKTEDGWKEVGFKKDVSFNDLAQILKPNEAENRTLNLEEYFYLPLSAGEYRLTDGYMLSEVFKIKEK